MKIASSLAFVLLAACGGKSASSTTPTGASGDIATWLASCISTAHQTEICSQVATSPDGKQVAVAYRPEDLGRGFTGLDVVIIDVATHKGAANHVIVEPANEDAIVVSPAVTANIGKAATQLKGWAVQTPAAAQLSNIPTGDDAVDTADITVNGKTVTVSLPEGLGCTTHDDDKPATTSSPLPFKSSALKATVLADGKTALVFLGGGGWPDNCSESNARIWVGSL
ncbi:MAG TPA: hypothetical protein PLF40_07425 [Kofleriaceae bacterium]|nr:hypothetical protein [Kofleriaceae bacterium]